MCDKSAYRPVEGEVKPRTEKEILHNKQKKMQGKKVSTGTDLMEDVVR